jgi:hypothetical protein
MVLLRLLQGFCIGGELPGALTYVVETAPKQAALVCGVVFACVTYGVAVATGVSVGVRSFLAPELVPEYGWRIAFILGGLGGIVSFIARRAMEESPEFARMKALAARQPFREVLQSHRGAVVTGIGLLALTGGFNGLYFSHMPGYLGRVLGYDARLAVVAATVAVVIHATMIGVVGWLARRIAPLTLLRAGTLGLLVLGYPFYTALAAKPVSPTWLLVGIGVVAGFINGTYAVLLTDLFPTRIRFGAGVQRGVLDVQRHGAAGGHRADSPHRRQRRAGHAARGLRGADPGVDVLPSQILGSRPASRRLSGSGARP